MEVLKYLKQIYQGKNTLANHVMLFSLLGILAILVNNILAYLGAGMVYFTFFAVPPSTKMELSINLFFAIMIIIYLFGYEYSFVNENFCNEKIKLAEFDLKPSIFVLKMFPLFLTWQIYSSLILIIGSFSLLSFGNMALSYVFYSLLICLMPFIHLIFIKYAYDFCPDKSLINPFVVFKFLDKSLGDVIYLFIQVFLLAVLPVLLIYGAVFFAHKVSSEPYKLSLYLFILCITLYFGSVLRFVYIAGLMKIVKEKFLITRE